MKCHNCGLPSHATTSPGYMAKLTIKAENKMQRDKHTTEWCCSRGCVIAAIGVSDMGIGTSKWSISLKELAKRIKPERYESLDRKENPPQSTENKEAKTLKTGGMAVTPHPLRAASQNAFNALSLMAQGFGIDCRGLDAADQEEIVDLGLSTWLGQRRNKGGRPVKYHTPEAQRKANAEHQRKFRQRSNHAVV